MVARLRSELASLLAFETLPQVRAHITCEYQELFALLAEVEAGRALRQALARDNHGLPGSSCSICCAVRAYDAAVAGPGGET